MQPAATEGPLEGPVSTKGSRKSLAEAGAARQRLACSGGVLAPRMLSLPPGNAKTDPKGVARILYS